jgi:HK97 family phage major capsid protein
LIGLCYATDELLQDASAMGAVMTQAFNEEFGFMVDNAIINGLGAGQPLGIMLSPALVSQAAEVGQAADTVVHENIVKMYSRMPARNRANAVWIINQDVEPQLYTMGLPVGAAGMPSYMPPGGLSGAPYATLMGRPVLAMEQADTVGDLGDIMFVDPSQYLMIDKGGVQSASSIHVAFLTDETAFRFVYRCDGQPMWVAPVTPFQSAITLSPFVALAAR